MAQINEKGKVVFEFENTKFTIYIYQDDVENRIFEDRTSATIDEIPNPIPTNIILDEINEYFEEKAELIEVFQVVDNNSYKVKILQFHIDKLNLDVMLNATDKYYENEEMWENYGLSYSVSSLLENAKINTNGGGINE